MTKYISNPENLKLMMNMLRDKSRNIQFEAFHVFKVRSDLVWVVTPWQLPSAELLLREDSQPKLQLICHLSMASLSIVALSANEKCTVINIPSKKLT